MSDERNRSYLAPIPYPLCDALFTDFFDVYASIKDAQARRKARTAGSAIYTITAKGIAVGTVRLRQANDDSTYMVTDPAITKNSSAQLNILEMILGMFWSYYEHRTEQDQKAKPLQTLPIVDQITERLADLAPPRLKVAEPREPQLGDSAEIWLDWRERELERTGRRISLSRIAKMGNFKQDTLKKKSAARSRQKTEEAEEAEE